MKENSVADRFLELAASEMDLIRAALPSDPNGRMAILLEVLRSLDCTMISQSVSPEDQRLPAPDFHMIQWGWNALAELLMQPVAFKGAIPLLRRNRNSASIASSLLHQAGRASLLKRTSDMIRCGILSAEESRNCLIVRQIDNSLAMQFADELEVSNLSALMNTFRNESIKEANGWTLVDQDHMQALSEEPGAFFNRNCGDSSAEWNCDDLNERMASLIFPCDSGRGIMMGYGADPDVDNKFHVEGAAFIDSCRRDAGLHPESAFGDTPVSDVLIVAAIVAGFHIKHVQFALLARKAHATIDSTTSLTAWGPKAQIVEAIASCTGFDSEKVDRALSAITVKASESAFYVGRTTPLIPMLIDLENGFILRPVSSVCRNPLSVVLPLAHFRGTGKSHEVIKPREQWMRDELYAMFQGARYAAVPGNVKLRKGKLLLTDVDAAILDKTSGDVALFQLKWQDFNTNDIRELRSKATNFVREIDSWADRVGEWVSCSTVEDMQNTFRFGHMNGPLGRVFIFVVSRHACRMEGLGAKPMNAHLALATLPQLLRVRAEVGPAPEVFARIHAKLCEDYRREPSLSPMVYQLNLSSAEVTVRYDDFFMQVDDDTKN